MDQELMDQAQRDVWNIVTATGCPIAMLYVVCTLGIVLYVAWRVFGKDGIVWAWLAGKKIYKDGN